MTSPKKPKNWPSKKKGKPSGGGRDNNTPKKTVTSKEPKKNSAALTVAIQHASILFVALVLFMFSCTTPMHYAKVIGTVDATGSTIIDAAQLQQQWETWLNSNGVSIKLESITLMKENDDYALVATNTDSSTVVAIELVLDGDQLYESAASGGSITVSCSGCTAGCTPRKEHGLWICKYPCKACTKTETVTDDGKAIFQP